MKLDDLMQPVDHHFVAGLIFFASLSLCFSFFDLIATCLSLIFFPSCTYILHLRRYVINPLPYLVLIPPETSHHVLDATSFPYTPEMKGWEAKGLQLISEGKVLNVFFSPPPPPNPPTPQPPNPYSVFLSQNSYPSPPPFPPSGMFPATGGWARYALGVFRPKGHVPAWTTINEQSLQVYRHSPSLSTIASVTLLLCRRRL